MERRTDDNSDTRSDMACLVTVALSVPLILFLVFVENGLAWIAIVAFFGIPAAFFIWLTRRFFQDSKRKR